MDPPEAIARGLDLVEVFRVIYLGNAEVPPKKQIGTIRIDDGLNSQYLYNVDKVDESRKPIQHGDDIILTGPTLRILGDGYVTLDINLFCGNYKNSIEFCELRPSIDGEPMKRIIPSEDGTGEICIFYTVFVDATTANLEIKVTSLESTSYLYGIIGAGTEAIQEPQFTSILYASKVKQRATTQPGGTYKFPLSRSIIAVPLDSQLVIHFNLIADEDDEIVKGSLEFVPNRLRYMEGERYLVGKKARMDVKVTWMCGSLTDQEKNVRAANRLRIFQNWFETSGLHANRTHYP